MIRPTRACASSPWPAPRRSVLAACGGDSDDELRQPPASDEPPSETQPPSPRATAPSPSARCSRRPVTSRSSARPEFAGVDLAVKEINDAGGVLGKPVEQDRRRLR